jgi:PAS domain S-box-containing protein
MTGRSDDLVERRTGKAIVSTDCPMNEPKRGGIYVIELCSGEFRRWHHLGPGGQSQAWWRDIETGLVFSENSVMYAWRIAGQENPMGEVAMEGNVQAVSSLGDLILEQAADALIYANHEGVIERWNAAATSIFGYSFAEAYGQSLDLIIPESLRAAHWRGFHAAMASGSTRLHGRPTLTRAERKTGERIYVEMSFSLVSDELGKAIGSVAMARDATERVVREKAAAIGKRE